MIHSMKLFHRLQEKNLDFFTSDSFFYLGKDLGGQHTYLIGDLSEVVNIELNVSRLKFVKIASYHT